MNLIKWRNAAFFIVLLLLLLAVPFITHDMYYLSTITFIFISVLLAASIWLILTTGQVTLGHAGFAAIGAYISAAVVINLGLSSWLGLLCGIVATGIVAVFVGYVTLRIKDIYFIFVTLALGEVIVIIFSMFDFFGGVIGLMNLPSPNAIGPISFTSNTSLYYLTLVLVIISLIIIYRVARSPAGRIFRGISQADNLAEHIGIDIMKYKVLAFVIGSVFAGLAGVLYTYSTSSILPTSFTLSQSVMYLVYVAVGGAASIAGPILGAVVFSIFSEVLKPIVQFEPIIYGLILIGVILLFRRGLLGAVQLLWRKINTLNRSNQPVVVKAPLKTEIKEKQ